VGSVEDECIRWGGYRRRGRGSYGVEFEASHCNQRSLCCVYSCEKVREPMELSFEVVSEIGCGMGVLEGGPRALRVRGGFVNFVPRCFGGGVNRHLQAKRAKYSNVHIMETTTWIPTEFCTTVKTSKYASWVVQKRG